jgi:hypothetical protein
VLAFPGVSRIFPADAALGLSLRIIGEKNTAVNRILGQGPGAKRYNLTNKDPETIHIGLSSSIFVWHSRPRAVSEGIVDRSPGPIQARFWLEWVEEPSAAQKISPRLVDRSRPRLRLSSPIPGKLSQKEKVLVCRKFVVSAPAGA